MAAPSPKSDEVVFVLDHESRIRFAWDMVQCVAVLLLLAYLPYRIGFQLLDWRPWIGPDIVHDLLIYTDIILNLCTSIEVEGEYISERRVIMTEYAKTWLIPDILSVIPLDLCTLSLGYYQPAFRSNRLIRLTRIYYYFGEIEKRAPIKPTAVKLVKAAIALIVACHMYASLYYLFILIEGTEATLSYQGAMFDISTYSDASKYFRSLYWAFAVFTGYNNALPKTSLETCFMFCVTISGILYSGIVIGAVGEIVTNLDQTQVYFRQLLDDVHEYMQRTRIPDRLQRDVLDYYSYLWKRGKAFDKGDILDELPPFLRSKIAFQLNNEILVKVPLFKDYAHEVGFITAVVQCLQSFVCIPNFLVVRKGEIGTEMYFVSQGELNVVNEDQEVVFTLNDGSFFGEIALLYETRRTATIVSRTFCDLFVLTKDDFKKVRLKFPRQSRGIKEIGRQRFQKVVDDEKKAEIRRRTQTATADAVLMQAMENALGAPEAGNPLARPAPSESPWTEHIEPQAEVPQLNVP